MHGKIKCIYWHWQKNDDERGWDRSSWTGFCEVNLNSAFSLLIYSSTTAASVSTGNDTDVTSLLNDQGKIHEQFQTKQQLFLTAETCHVGTRTGVACTVPGAWNQHLFLFTPVFEIKSESIKVSQTPGTHMVPLCCHWPCWAITEVLHLHQSPSVQVRSIFIPATLLSSEWPSHPHFGW